MLIFSRKENERIRIGENIVIQVTRITNGRVRIGVEAPKEIPVHRDEVFKRIQEKELHGGRQAATDAQPSTELQGMP